MSKSVELLSRSEDGEPTSGQRHTEERSRLNLNGSRQLSRSATELRDNQSDTPNRSPVHRARDNEAESVIRHRHRHVTVAQRTHTFFATLKSRWARSRSKERKKSKDASSFHGPDSYKNLGPESDYAADYSSEHSRSSSATQSPAKHYLSHPESPLTRSKRDKIGLLQEDSSGRCSDGSSKGSSGFQGQKDTSYLEEMHHNGSKDADVLLQDEITRRRELALRQHAFFQLRLHIRRGANLVAMDRCGASDPYVKIKSAGRLLHKSRTVHRDLNPTWDESVTLPIEDPFQPLTVKVFDYDWGLQDDFMGAAALDLTLLELGHPQDITLELKDPARPRQHLGEIFLTATLWPRNQQEKEQEIESSGGKRRFSSGRILDKIAETLRKNDQLDKVEVILDHNLLQKNLPLGDSPSRIKRDKLSVSSFKECLEKKKELVEKILENRVERIWEDKIERHPWLQPIEAWIIERQNRSSKPSIERGYSSDSELKGKDFKEGFKTSRSGFLRKSPARKRVIRCHDKVKSKTDGATTEVATSTGEDQKIGNSETVNDVIVSRKPSASSLNDSLNLEKHEQKNTHQDEERSQSPDFFDKIKENLKDKIEDIHRYFQRSNRLADVNRKLKSQIWSSVVTIVLVEAKNLLPMDIEGLSDPYVKFRLGTEKYKSKVANKTLNPVWLEQFDLHLYEDPHLGQELEVTVWDRDKGHQDDLMGKTIINLATLEREATHRLWRDLEDGAGSIFLLLTISGTTASETISDLAAHEETPQERTQLLQRYSLANTLQRPKDVGHLIVKVYRAQGLAAADLGGKSDPFCVLELINARLQTQTEYKTLAPNWQKIFTFNVKDINSVLEVTVYDEDRDHKVEFLGKVAIPLLRIRNGEKMWYALKDKKLRGRAKGNSPQILLEMTVVWNILRACVRTINPKEKKYMEPEMKFKRQVFLRNVLRLKAIIVIFIDLGKYIQSCFEWESKMRSIFALVLFVLGCYYFEPYMIPTAALLILLKYYMVAVLTGAPLPHQVTHHVQDSTETASDDGPPTPGDDDDDDDDKDKEEKKSLKERLQAIQEVTQTVQNSIGYLASLCEKVKNLFNFTVPYLSYLAMIMTIIGAIVLYIIPVRYLILAWGVNKFSRKIFRPHSVPNNEVLDLISRVPDDEEILNYRELKPLPTADCERGGTSASTSGNLSRRELRKRHKAA